MANLLEQLIEKNNSVERKELETSNIIVTGIREAIKKDGTRLENMSVVDFTTDSGTKTSTIVFNNVLKGFPATIIKPFAATMQLGMSKDTEGNDVIRTYSIEATEDVKTRDMINTAKAIGYQFAIAV